MTDYECEMLHDYEIYINIRDFLKIPKMDTYMSDYECKRLHDYEQCIKIRDIKNYSIKHRLLYRYLTYISINE